MMSVSSRHFLHQGPVIAAVARTAASALFQTLRPQAAGDMPVPGPEYTAVSAPLPADLIRDYVNNVGGDPAAYGTTVPAHLFPQWTFPLAARTLTGLPYPLARVVNGGCRLRCNAPLPAGTPLYAQAHLESIDDNGRRAVLQQHITSGPSTRPDAIVADLYAIVPLGGGAKKVDEPQRANDEKPTVPVDAREIASWQLAAHAGFDFAKLTGDINPIHWIPAYARMSGFRSVILHGFATMARAFEGLVHGICAGRVERLRELDVRFTRPLVLPARVGLYVRGTEVFVGDAPGGAAYLVGTYVVDAEPTA